MDNIISVVYEGSIAEELGIEKGDKLISINDSKVKDIIDYRFLVADEFIIMEIEKSNGEVWQLEIEKEYDETIGIEFENAILDKAKSCHNKCIFCFIDQLPKGMRDTMYFKDDDSRLSFLQGNFVTLTNMKDEDIDRIIKYRISPINVSVHTTNPELRKKMLNNRFAGDIYERLKKLSEARISINCQIVLCPGINDGEELVKTTEDLYKLYPSIQNVAVVPVGVTKYREGLYDLKLFDSKSALEQIELVKTLQEKYIKEISTPFIRMSDEFYVLAKKDVPDLEFYNNFKQIEDGVGMIRLYRENIKNGLDRLKPNKKGSFTMVTGVSAYEEILKSVKEINSANTFLKINVVKIINNYFGETITVAGLLTGKDIIEQLIENNNIGEYIIIPKNMLKNGEKIFLDDVTVSELEHKLQRKVLVCEYTGEDLIDIINEYSKED